MPDKFKAYRDAVAYIDTLSTLPVHRDYLRKKAENHEFYLRRTKRLLELLGNPEKGLRYVHIGGTSGKGTTAAMVHNILNSAGYKVGAFCSPYTTTIIENIKVGDKLISPATFVRLLNKQKTAIQQMQAEKQFGRPSYFEVLFAMALQYFQEQTCDFAVLEVGLGGSFDATNAIADSVSAITNIGLDHTHILGKTLSAIARDKTGIIKPGSHFFTTEKRPKILAICQEKCRRQKALFHQVVPTPGERPNWPSFQKENAALASAITRHLGVSQTIIDKALAKPPIIPCRFEIMRRNPFIILDGAHNPDKIKSVVHNLKNLTYGKLYIIFASAQNKNARAMIAKLAPLAAEIIFTKANTTTRAFREPAALAKMAPPGCRVKVMPKPLEALAYAKKRAAKNDVILATGSFYIMNELRGHFFSENKILSTRKLYV